jgi:hypothetical protein
MTLLVLLTLAVLALWEVARRLLPFRLPVVLDLIAIFFGGLALLTWASPHILLAMAATGALVVLGAMVPFARAYPWGPLAAALLLRLTGREKTIGKDTDTHPKRRIPKLPT